MLLLEVQPQNFKQELRLTRIELEGVFSVEELASVQKWVGDIGDCSQSVFSCSQSETPGKFKTHSANILDCLQRKQTEGLKI